MDERQIGLALALKELGVSADVSGFDSRLILQKTVYLVEEAGIRLGYAFNWYLRGPYSPVLTRDLFELAANAEDVAGWVLDDRSRVIASCLKPLFAKNEETASKARRLELLASLHYLSRRGRINLDDHEAAKRQLAQNNKHYSEAAIATAVGELRQAELL